MQVWTTDTNKLAAIQNLLSAMFDGRILFAKRGATVGEVYKSTGHAPSYHSMRVLLASQLKSFRDMPDGSVSGKTASDEDDLAMSLLMNVYWSYCIRIVIVSTSTLHRQPSALPI